MKTERLFNLPVQSGSMEDVVQKIYTTILSKSQLFQVSLNASKIVSIQKDKELMNSVKSADLLTADGQSLVWASKLLGQPLPERIAGIDLFQELMELAYRKGLKVFFLGAKPEVLDKVVGHYTDKYGIEIVAGAAHGYFKPEEEGELVERINNSGAQMLFVAITSPMKELFLDRNKEKLNRLNLVMGVGGSFDVVAGKVKRAPLWMQKNGLEWFYRFQQEPGRLWKRYLVSNSKFLWITLNYLVDRLKSRVQSWLGFGAGYHDGAKRRLDLIVSTTAILLVFPWLLPIIALLVKASSPGPVFFKQTRTGKDGKEFTCFKFRTMRINGEAHTRQALLNDCRITKIGRFLRRSFMDELPQLFNVFLGSMSLIGPRPHMVKHTEEYSEAIPSYPLRLAVKPGMTGLAQVLGCFGSTETLPEMKSRVKYDLIYARRFSLSLDFQILFQTVALVFSETYNLVRPPKVYVPARHRKDTPTIIANLNLKDKDVEFSRYENLQQAS